MDQMEREIAELFQKSFGENLVSLIVIGSYGTYDIVEGYSDYDLLVLVKDAKNVPIISLERMAQKYALEMGFSAVPYVDFENRLADNKKATRFVSNIFLVELKEKARVLAGKNIKELIPEVHEIVQRDIRSEWQENYEHAVSEGQSIFKRKPEKWVNYIINMSDALLLGQGVAVPKKDIPAMLEKYHPQFLGTDYVKQSLILRQTKKVLALSEEEKEELRKMLVMFLEEYRKYVFLS